MARAYKLRIDAVMEIYARMTAEERVAVRYIMQGYDMAARDRKAEEPGPGEQDSLIELGSRMTEAG